MLQVLIFLIFVASPVHAASTDIVSCEALLIIKDELTMAKFENPGIRGLALRIFERRIRRQIQKRYDAGDLTTDSEVAAAVQESIERVVGKSRRIRGYAMLIGTMVGTAALTTHLTAALPASARVLSQLLGQVSTIAMYVLGAPVFEPISSAYRRRAFGFSAPPAQLPKAAPELEALWRGTQGTYSQNAQMSRNIINQFLNIVRHSFEAAAYAMGTPNPILGRAYAVDQLAETAIRMRRLFAEISPEDKSVALNVDITFLRPLARAGISVEGIVDDVLRQIQSLDPDASEPEAQDYYVRIVRNWFVRS